MFIDKDHLLTKLNQLYDTCMPCCVSLYSYPGEGRSRLLGEFLKGKRTLFYKASCVSWQENFRLLRSLCLRELGERFASVTRTSGLIKALKKASLAEPLVLILDNFQYLSSQNRRLSTQLLALEKEGPACQLFVILCKPSSLWEKDSPREDRAFRLRNFNFFELCRLYPELSPMDQMLLYSVTGGNPGLLDHFSSDFSVKENLEQLFFREKGSLYRLVPEKLQKHYGSSPLMAGILAAIGSIPRHLQEICDQTELTPSAASSLLASLEKQGLTEKLVPVTESFSSRRALYRILDSAFRFWYTFVYPFQGEIEAGKGREIFQKHVLPVLSVYLKSTFENISFPETDSFYIKEGKSFLIEEIRNDLYFQKDGKREWILINDPRKPRQSIANLFLAEEASEGYRLSVTLDMYGYKEAKDTIRLKDWLGLCEQEGCTPYFGMKSKTDSTYTGTVFMVNEACGFVHMLSVAVPIRDVGKREGLIEGRLFVYIPARGFRDKLLLNITDYKAIKDEN